MLAEMALSLIRTLEKTTSLDQNELEAAEKYLDHEADSNFTTFIKMLSDILVQEKNSKVARKAAGLRLKNHLTSEDPDLKRKHQQRWLALPEDIRLHIKKNILAAIGTDKSQPSSAAQCVALVAAAELAVGQWDDLIPSLVENVLNAQSTETKKIVTLEAIGYICEEIDAQVLTKQSTPMLAAIIHGMKSTESSNHVRLAATQSLLNFLQFTKGNLDKENDRNSIMEVVFEATRSSDLSIRAAALQCLANNQSLFYQYLEPYMDNLLIPNTVEAMKLDVDEISLQGIEFWSSVCNEEIDLFNEKVDADEAGRDPLRTSKFYARGALPYIAPVLTQKLIKQHSNVELEHPSNAATNCLLQLSNCCCEDEIAPYVLPFIRSNIKNEKWRYREAAIMAFGSILDGLEEKTLGPLLEKSMPTLIEAMYDSSMAVREAAAWTFSRIFNIVTVAAINKIYLKPLLESLVNGLKAETRIATNVCLAFSGLSKSVYEVAGCGDDSNLPKTYLISNNFDFIVQRLLETMTRQDAERHNLMDTAYNALIAMVKNSPTDCYVNFREITMAISERLQFALQMENHISSQADRSRLSNRRILLLTALQSVLRKVTPEDAPQISDDIMTALLTIFADNAGKSGVQLDAFMTVCILVNVLGKGFLKYMDAFNRHLCAGLKNHQEYEVCIEAVDLTGDICRALEKEVHPYCDEIIGLLQKNFCDPSIHRSIKPHVLTVFAVIALSIDPEYFYSKYFHVVMPLILEASNTQVDSNDYEMVQYLVELRSSVLEAYAGILYTLKAKKGRSYVAVVEPHVPAMVNFLKQVACEPDRTDELTALIAGLTGDLCSVFHQDVPTLLAEKQPLLDVLQAARRSREPRTKSLGNWATKEFRKLERNSALREKYNKVA